MLPLTMTPEEAARLRELFGGGGQPRDFAAATQQPRFLQDLSGVSAVIQAIPELREALASEPPAPPVHMESPQLPVPEDTVKPWQRKSVAGLDALANVLTLLGNRKERKRASNDPWHRPDVRQMPGAPGTAQLRSREQQREQQAQRVAMAQAQLDQHTTFANQRLDQEHARAVERAKNNNILASILPTAIASMRQPQPRQPTQPDPTNLEAVESYWDARRGGAPYHKPPAPRSSGDPNAVLNRSNATKINAMLQTTDDPSIRSYLVQMQMEVAEGNTQSFDKWQQDVEQITARERELQKLYAGRTAQEVKAARQYMRSKLIESGVDPRAITYVLGY